MKKVCVILFTLLLANTAFSQGEISKEKLLLTQVGVGIGYYLPLGDMGSRYSGAFRLGGGFNVKNRKNWTFGLDGGYLFNDAVRNPENYLLNMRTELGEVISQDGSFAEIIMNMRGLTLNASIGRVFDVIGPNPNSGIVVRFGVGYLQHKIHIEARRDDVPQFEEDMRQYYDQLTGGLTLNQFIGYQHLSNSRLTNFFVGIEAFQGFTRNLRNYNIDLGGKDDRQRFDGLLGLKAGWLLLIYKRKPQEFYFY